MCWNRTLKLTAESLHSTLKSRRASLPLVKKKKGNLGGRKYRGRANVFALTPMQTRREKNDKGGQKLLLTETRKINEELERGGTGGTQREECLAQQKSHPVLPIHRTRIKGRDRGRVVSRARNRR